MAVIQLLNYKRSNPAIQLSLVDMLFDTEKRNATYANYDSKYQSTKEEDEIFEEMRACYREEDWFGERNTNRRFYAKYRMY